MSKSISRIPQLYHPALFFVIPKSILALEFQVILQKKNMKTISWQDYMNLFDDILDKKHQNSPYDKEAYFNYVKLNHSRLNRWLKTVSLNSDVIKTMEQINQKQQWMLITEPWCGDAAHSTPFIKMLADVNPRVEFKIVLRDSNLEFMDQYLTNGGRSIPKLVVRDENDADLWNWGPRPSELQQIHSNMKKEQKSFDEINQVLQSWYNQDKGASIQNELLKLISQQNKQASLTA